MIEQKFRDHGMSPKKDIGMKRLEIIIDLQTFKQLLRTNKKTRYNS